MIRDLSSRASPSRLALALPLALCALACAEDADPWAASAEAAAWSILPSSVALHLTALAADDMEGRDNLSAGGKKARDYLVLQMTALGLKPAGKLGWEQPFDKGVNVLGLLPGRDESLTDQHVILSAHYDHLGVAGTQGSQCHASASAPGDKICNGASDNAAGCAAVLAMVQALSGSAMGLRRPLLVVFWDAEEDGLLGSTHYAGKEPLLPLDRTVAMLTLDTLGGELFRGYSALFALGVEYSTGIREAVHGSNARADIRAHAVSEFFSGSTSSSGRSDHGPFKGKQVPFVFYSSGAPEQYHTPADEARAVDTDRLARIARHALLTTASLANGEGRPGFVSSPQPHLDDARAIVEIGKVVLADPSAAGLQPDDPALPALRVLLDRMEGYLKDPPDTDQEWKDYQSLVQSVITLVFGLMGM